MKLTTYSPTGTKGSMTAPDGLLADNINHQLLAQAVRVYQSNLRQGGGQTQRRSNVSVTKSKWYRQKGTGNARHGSKNAPLFVGGGVAHGPTGKAQWSKSLSQTQKRQALRAALTAQAEQLVVADAFEQLSGKTKAAAELLVKMGVRDQRVLVVVAEAKPDTVRAVRNLPNVLLTKANRVNALEVAMANTVIVTKSALEVLVGRVSAGKSQAKVATKSVAKPKTTTKASPKPAKTSKKQAKSTTTKKTTAKKTAK